MKKLISGVTVILLLSGSAAWAQQANEFSVKQAADYGLKNAVQVKNALLDVLIQQQSNRDITSAAYPDIKATGSFNDYLNIPTSLLPGEFFGGAAGTFIPVKFGTKYSATGGVALNQLLFDGQVFVGLQARKTSIDARQKAAEVTQENIKANIYKIYYQLVVSKTQIDLLDANIVRLQKLDHDTREIYKNGFAEKVDVDKLTVQIANLQTEKLKALNSVANGYMGLKVLMGMPIKDSLVLTDTLSDTQIKENILESSNYKYNDRKEYQLLELTNKLNTYNIKRYKLSQIPTLSLNANYNKQAQRTAFDFLKKGDWFTTSYIGFSLNVPMFKGFSTRAKIAKSKLELQQTQNQLEGLKINIDNDVEVAKNNFTTAAATMDYQKQNMALAELVYEQTKKKYEIGTGSATEINTAQVELKTAQTNYISALYDAIIARVDLLKATGKL
ncbi:MAG: TolC family protein [Ferruginibacter sp.]|nr:TolC family protein [Ferruginibacter sp.]